MKRIPFCTRFMIGLLSLSVTLSACKKSPPTDKATAQRVVTATLKPFATPTYFNAFIEPLSIIKVTTPVDGTIDTIHFAYGEKITQNQNLIELSSESLERDYQDKLFKYLKAKQTFQTDKSAWGNTQELNRYGLISKLEIETQKNKLADSTLGVVQAKQELQEILDTLGIRDFDFSKLDIHNTQDAIQRLSAKLNKITITSPASGLALLPGPSAKDHQDKLTQGSPVKKNDVLLTIGDLSGVTLNIKVNETQIKQIKLQQFVDISFIALPQVRLQGVIARIDTQAQSVNNDNPTFPVQVLVKTLPEQYRELVLVGMSAKLRVQEHQQTALMVPIDAIYQKEGKSYVDIVSSNDIKNKTPVEVKTGATNLNEVTILHGLKSGDRVVVNSRPTQEN